MKNRLKELRKAQGSTLEEVGKAIGFQGNTICRYENSDREPTFEIWKKLAHYFDTSVPYLQGYPFAKCHWCGNEFVLVDKKDRDMYFYCPYCGRSPLDFGDKKESAKTEHQDEKKEFLKLENEKDTLDDAIGFLNELISTSEELTNAGKSDLAKVVRVLYNIYYDDTHAYWKTK